MLDTFLSLVYLLFSLSHPPARLLSMPQQVRTAWTSTPGELMVAWVTQYPVAGAHLQYSLSACQDRDIHEERRVHVEAVWKCVQKANKVEWQYLNQAIMGGLDPLCVYQYRVGSFLSMSPYFRISGLTPSADTVDRKVTFAVIGDMGVGGNSSDVREHLHELSVNRYIDAVLHVGDMAYSLNDKWKQTADRYFTEMEPIAAYVPYMVFPGNHERSENFTQYIQRFRMPWNEASKDTNFFYSFNIGKAHIVMYNTEAYFAEDQNMEATQYNWLVKDLRKANSERREVPWVVVLGHKPYYCAVDWTRPMEKKNWESNYDCTTRAELLRKAVEELFYAAGVDLYIAGHIHRYERSAAIYHNSTLPSQVDTLHYHFNPKAPVFILEGSAGSRKVTSTQGLDDLSTTPQNWTRSAAFKYGLGTLEICNATHLVWRQFDSASREVLDQVVIEKSRTRYYPATSDLIGS